MKLSTVRNIAKKQLAKHNLKNYKIVFCKLNGDTYARTVYATETIEICKDRVLNSSYALVQYVILHEVAHALTPGEEHGSEWSKMLSKISEGRFS